VMTEVQILLASDGASRVTPSLSGNDDVMTEVQILLASDGASRLTPLLSGNDDVMTEVQRLLESDGASRLTSSLSLSELDFDGVKTKLNETGKNLTMGIFDVAPKFFNDGLIREKKMSERLEWYFVDYSLMPLFVQENYLNYRPNRAINPQTGK